MLQNKLKFEFPADLKPDHARFIQQDVLDDFENEVLDDCGCEQIRVLVYGLSPLEHHYSASFNCNCRCERSPIKDRKLQRPELD